MEINFDTAQYAETARVCQIHVNALTNTPSNPVPRSPVADENALTEYNYPLPPEIRTFIATGVERAIEWVVNWRRSYPGSRFLADYHSTLAWIPLEIRQAVLQVHSRLAPVARDANTHTDVEVEVSLDDDYIRSDEISDFAHDVPENLEIPELDIGSRTVELYHD